MAFDAIVLDTQTIDNYHWCFDEGMLARMRQFCSSDVKFLMPDIIKNEVLAHLTKRIKESQDILDKSLRDSHSEGIISDAAFESLTKNSIQNILPEEFASSKFDSFLKNSGALDVVCSEFTNLSEVFNAYFNFNAPFKNNKKRKEEFPDATILFALENYAKSKNIEIVVVSRDGGWIDYCNDSERLTCIPDLGEALTHFQPRTAPYTFAQQLIVDIGNQQAQPLLSLISQAVISKYDDIDFIPEADSYLSFDAEVGYCHVSDVDFEENVNVIEIGQGFATFEIKAIVTYSAECEFSFYHYDSIDKENIYMAASTEETEVEDDTSVIFTIYGDYDESYGMLNVGDVELTSKIKYISFGDVEPHFEPDHD